MDKWICEEVFIKEEINGWKSRNDFKIIGEKSYFIDKRYWYLTRKGAYKNEKFKKRNKRILP